MKFELYVRHILQEHPDFEMPAANWTGRWVKSPTYGKFCPCKGSVARVPTDELSDVMSVFLRSESFGGLMYDSRTTAIYKLDKEAFSLVQDLQSIMNKKSIKKNDPNIESKLSKLLNKDKDTIHVLIKSLQDVNLW